MGMRIAGRQRLFGAVAALVVAFAVAIAPSTPARADGCSVGDIGQALVDATKTFPWACSTNFDDPYFWALTGLIGIASGISNTGGHDYISDGCGELNDIQKKLAEGAEDAATVKKDLNTLINNLGSFPDVQAGIKDLINSLGLGGLLDGSDNSGVVQDVGDAVSALSSALSYLTCACNMVFSP